MVKFSKFTLDIIIYKQFVGFLSKLVWRETLFFVLCGTNADFYVNDTDHIGSNECDMQFDNNKTPRIDIGKSQGKREGQERKYQENKEFFFF